MTGEFPALNLSVNGWTKITQRKKQNVSPHPDEVAHHKAQKTKIKASHCEWFLFKAMHWQWFPLHYARSWKDQTFELVRSGRGTKATCTDEKRINTNTAQILQNNHEEPIQRSKISNWVSNAMFFSLPFLWNSACINFSHRRTEEPPWAPFLLMHEEVKQTLFILYTCSSWVHLTLVKAELR